MSEKVWTYDEFVSTMSLEDIQGWHMRALALANFTKNT